MSKKKKLVYPYNLICEIVGEEYNENYSKESVYALNYFLRELERRDQIFLLERFQDNKATEKIAEEQDVSKEFVDQRIALCIRTLRHAVPLQFIREGLSGVCKTIKKESEEKGYADGVCEVVEEIIGYFNSEAGSLAKKQGEYLISLVKLNCPLPSSVFDGPPISLKNLHCPRQVFCSYISELDLPQNIVTSLSKTDIKFIGEILLANRLISLTQIGKTTEEKILEAIELKICEHYAERCNKLKGIQASEVSSTPAVKPALENSGTSEVVPVESQGPATDIPVTEATTQTPVATDKVDLSNVAVNAASKPAVRSSPVVLSKQIKTIDPFFPINDLSIVIPLLNKIPLNFFNLPEDEFKSIGRFCRGGCKTFEDLVRFLLIEFPHNRCVREQYNFDQTIEKVDAILSLSIANIRGNENSFDEKDCLEKLKVSLAYITL